MAAALVCGLGNGLALQGRRPVIDGCEYHSSQPWPFPSSIMLGFWATARRGEVNVPPGELEEARWFHRDQVLAQEVRLPPKLSIARRLIDDWLRARG